MDEWKELVDGHNHIPLLVRERPAWADADISISEHGYDFGAINIRMGSMFQALDVLGQAVAHTNQVLMRDTRKHFREKHSLADANAKRLENLVDLLVLHTLSLHHEMHGVNTGRPVIFDAPESDDRAEAKRQELLSWLSGLVFHFTGEEKPDKAKACKDLQEILREPIHIDACKDYMREQPEDVDLLRRRIAAYTNQHNVGFSVA